MSIPSSAESERQLVNIRLLAALALVLLFHGALLPFTASVSYDANIHMFFGNSYARAWFDPWDPRWYTGFTTTSYPPGTHMGIGAFSFFLPLAASFNVMILIGLCTFVLGVYRFSLLFVSARAAGYSALAAVFSSSIVETVHIFGQLPTIFSLGLFLNGLPHVYRWMVHGHPAQLGLATAFACSTTAAHHVTTLFGALLFIGPVGLYAWIAYLDVDTRWRDAALPWWKKVWEFMRPAIRGGVLAVLLVCAIALIVFPYWYWSVTDPITQVSIPHGSRESFLERGDLGIVFFVIPWGAMIFVLPYVAVKAFKTRMWPLSASILVCFILGTGGTTPLPKMVLGPAFDILTLDRFTFWATILILPFTGMLAESVFHGRLRTVLTEAFGRRWYTLGTIFTLSLFVSIAVLVAVLSTIRPTQPNKIDPVPIVKFMGEDQHDRWRYLTLGFGDQFAYISALMNAESVDGNYHSVRRLPELVSYAVERLENSKYLGVPGLGSLQQFLVNSDKYHLKFVFSNDAFYDPLLHFTGWNRLRRLPNNIVVWEKPDTAPLPAIKRRRSFPLIHRLMWGILPPAALLTGYSILLITTIFRGAGHVPMEYRPITKGKLRVSDANRARRLVRTLGCLVLLVFGGICYAIISDYRKVTPPDKVLANYYHNLDFRFFHKAFIKLETRKGVTFEAFLLWQRWEGGLLASYAKLIDLETKRLASSEGSVDWEVTRTFVTPFGVSKKTDFHRTVIEDGHWKITAEQVGGYTPSQRIQSEPAVSWNRAGKRRPILAQEHSDIMDRPNLSVLDARLVKISNIYRLVGLVRNDDVDPASVKFASKLRADDGSILNVQQAGTGSAHRLLPGELGSFNIRFGGVLSLDAELESGAFDPKLYVPLELPVPPTSASVSVSATVNEANLYRSLSFTGAHVVERDGKLELRTDLTNTGTKQAELIQLQVALFGDDGRIANTAFHFLEQDLKPGQTRSINFGLPDSEAIKIIADVKNEAIRTNGVVLNAFDQRIAPQYLPGFIPLPKGSGYSGLTLTVRTMNFAPLF